MEDLVPVVFISYCWSSEQHKEWVLNLAQKLVSESGVEVILDRWHGVVGHDRFQFMEESIKRADKVLIICDITYCEKANNREGSVGFETSVITPEIYGNTKQEKFIPIAFERKCNGDYLLPDFISSRFALGMFDQEDFERDYAMLERLVWQEPKLKPPVRGEKPAFNKAEVEPCEVDQVIDESDEERVIWLLPRGFLLYSEITFNKDDSWATLINHYNYKGDFQYSTHYHKSYARSWDNDIETQYHKLSLPKADWVWCRAPLNFLQELREVNGPIDINDRVRKRQQWGDPVFYYKPGEPILLPKVPNDLMFYYETGNLRDIFQDIKGEVDGTKEELILKAETIRQNVYMEVLALVGEKHPALTFVKEIIDDFNQSFSYSDIVLWFGRLEKTLDNTLNHLYKERK